MLHFDLSLALNGEPPKQHCSVQKAVWRGVLHFTMFSLPACAQLIGPPAGPSCCPSSSSCSFFLHDALLTSRQNSILKNKPSAPVIVGFVRPVKNTRRYLRRACASAVKHSWGGWQAQSRCHADLHTWGEVSWRSGGEPWSIEGSLISLPPTQDTVVSFDAPDSKGDLWTARLQSRGNKQFIERACIHTAAVRLERWQLLMWSNAAIMSDTSLLGRKSNKSQTRIHWCPRNRISRTLYKDERVEFRIQKGNDYAVINIYVSSFCYWRDISVSISPGWKRIKD